MERKAVVVCALVGFLGVLSAALGFAAEGTRVKEHTSDLHQEPTDLTLSGTALLSLRFIHWQLYWIGTAGDFKRYNKIVPWDELISSDTLLNELGHALTSRVAFKDL